jgi:hypothetical protein
VRKWEAKKCIFLLCNSRILAPLGLINCVHKEVNGIYCSLGFVVQGISTKMYSKHYIIMEGGG